MHLPAPPLLKTTIIQLNKDIDPEDNNYEILTNEYSGNSSAAFSSQNPAAAEEQPRKKRRRSSSFVDDEELARRRNETKQLHSIIEKRRRIKINREFEALKYLIPACRNTDNGTKRTAANNNNGSKIDGMYKLTILKSAVEYILYLHHIVHKQHQLLNLSLSAYNYDVAYSTVPLDVNQYRNIDKEFDFADLAAKAADMATTSSKSRFEPISEHKDEEPLHTQSGRLRNGVNGFPRAKSETFAMGRASQLPTPDVTPDIAPILSLLSKYSGDTQQLIAQQLKQKETKTVRVKEPESGQKPKETEPPLQTHQFHHDIDALNKTFLFDSTMHKSGSISSSTSPFTIPIKSQVKRSNFYLPDPAISTSVSSDSLTLEPSGSALPKKMYFRSKIPLTNSVANVGIIDTDLEVDEDLTEGERLEDASKTLLTLRKPSIEKLLN